MATKVSFAKDQKILESDQFLSHRINLKESHLLYPAIKDSFQAAKATVWWVGPLHRLVDHLLLEMMVTGQQLRSISQKGK